MEDSHLVIYAHPGTKGHNSFTLKKVKEELGEKDKGYETIDLYEEGYDPVLKKEEHYTAGNREVSEKTKEYQQKIKAHDKLIFIYPVWWGSMPAILKGFFDRVLTPGFGYSFKGDYFLKRFGWPKKLFREKKAAVFMTAGSSRWAYFLTGNPPKRIIKQFTLGFCGIKTKVYQVYNCQELDDKKRKKIVKNIRKAISWLE